MSSQFKLHKFAMTVVVAASTLIGPRAAFGAYTCDDVFSDTKEFQIKQLDLNGKKIEYRSVKVNDSALDADISGNKGDILIGISEGGHAYIVSQGVRVDGNLYPHPTRISRDPRLTRGVVIRIKSTDVDRTILESYHNTKSVTCAKTMCNVLEKSSGLYIGSQGKTFLSPDTVLRTILKNGIVDANGNKIPFDIYYLGRQDMQASMVELKKNTAQLRNGAVVTPVALVGGAVAMPVLAIVYITLSFTNDND